MVFGEWDTEEFGQARYNEGHAEGRNEGVIETWGAAVCSLMSQLNEPFDRAVQLLKIPADQIEAIRKQILQ